MRKTLLAEVLRSFSKEEMKRFIQFADSPYFNTSEATAKLLKEIGRFHPVIDGRGVSKEILFEKVYGAKKYSDTLMRKLISNLLHLSERFLTIENQQLAECSLLAGLRTKKLYTQFSKKIESIAPDGNNSIINEDVFLFSSLIESERSIYLYEIDRAREYDIAVLNTFKYDTLYYFYNLARTYIRASHNLIYNPSGKESLILGIVSSIDFEKLNQSIKTADPVRKEVLLHLFDLIKMELTKDGALFPGIKNFSFKYSELHPGTTTYIGYIYMFEFISYQLKNGNREYIYERHEIYRQLEKYSYSTNPGQMSLILFNNIFFSGIVTRDPDFSEYVLAKYISIIESKGNPELSKFYNAWILFNKGNFAESLKLITTFSTSGFLLDDHVITPSVKRLTLMLNYELGYYEEALYLLDSISHFMRNSKKLSETQKESMIFFTKVFRQLLMLKMNNREFSIRSARASIGNEVSAGNNWLIEKINELEKAGD
jgi:hypothetical protein